MCRQADLVYSNTLAHTHKYIHIYRHPLHLNCAYQSTRWLTDLLHRIYRICAFLLQLSTPVPLFALQPVETLLFLGGSDQATSGQPGILRRWSYGVERLAARHPKCFLFNYFQESTQDSRVFPVLLCNVIRVSYAVWRPCTGSDFMDMLRRLTNCRIIIIIINRRAPAEIEFGAF